MYEIQTLSLTVCDPGKLTQVSLNCNSEFIYNEDTNSAADWVVVGFALDDVRAISPAFTFILKMEFVPMRLIYYRVEHNMNSVFTYDQFHP